MLLPPSPMTARPKTSSPSRRAAQVPPTTRLSILPRWLIMGKRRRAASPWWQFPSRPCVGLSALAMYWQNISIGRGAQQQMGGEIAVQERDHVAARPQRHGKARRRGLVAVAHRHGPLHVALLEQFQQPLFHAARKEHERIGRGQELGLRKPLRKPGDLGNRPAAGVDPRQGINARRGDGRLRPCEVRSPPVPARRRLFRLLHVGGQSQRRGLFCSVENANAEIPPAIPQWAPTRRHCNAVGRRCHVQLRRFYQDCLGIYKSRS